MANSAILRNFFYNQENIS